MLTIDPRNSVHEKTMFVDERREVHREKPVRRASRVRTVRDVLIARFHLEGMLVAPSSASGGQLQALREERSGSDDSADWRRALSSGMRQILYADALLLTRDLDDEQVTVCRLRYWVPLDGHEEIEHQVRDGELVNAEVGCVQQRWRAKKGPRDLTMLPVRMTLGGDEYLRAADEGWAVVREVRAKLTSFETIAGWIGCSERQARTRLNEARSAVNEALVKVQGSDE